MIEAQREALAHHLGIAGGTGGTGSLAGITADAERLVSDARQHGVE